MFLPVPTAGIHFGGIDVLEYSRPVRRADVPAAASARRSDVLEGRRRLGAFTGRTELSEISETADGTYRHTFAEPGTYFVVARVASDRNGDTDAPYGVVQKLARVRVVVR